ncbi:MAG: hypothetical protein Q9P01_19495 [Anaerolineae bacterium]|nr:hypothetical protein [Anaerolineae bacterium]MDQ7036937.1 hypothetical protein [Anaerolineae bacterium]
MAQKQWMWQNEASGGVQGVIVDFDDGLVRWFDEPGCACGGNDSEQSIADFLERGARFIVPPDDVLEEMRASLKIHA